MRQATFNVVDHGAVGDGRALDTKAIQAAVDACAAAGGGRVELPAGLFVSGPIFLKSHTELHLCAGATLRADPNMDAYGPVDLQTHGHRINCFLASLVTAVQAENVAVTGRGTLDGNGKVWWDEIDAGRPGPRPVLVYFLDCDRVLLEGVRLLDSAAWTVLPLLCRNVDIRGIEIRNPWKPYHNCDGIDIHSCRDVRVSNCHIDTGDDGICLKSIPDWFVSACGDDASVPTMKVDYSLPRIPCENVAIDNCIVRHAHSGVSAWAEVIGGLGNLAVTNCIFDGTRTGIQFARYPWPGGHVHDCTIDNIIMRRVECGILVQTSVFPWQELEQGPDMETTPDIGRIRISNVSGTQVMVACQMYGTETNPVHDITLSNIRMESNLGFDLRHVRDVYFDNVEVACQNVPLVVKDAAGVEFRRFNPVVSTPEIPAIEVERVTDGWIHGCTAAPGTGVFLGEVGEGNDVRLENNRLARARRERAAVVPDNLWNICSHAFSGNRWVRDSGARNLWLPVPDAVARVIRGRWTPQQVDAIFSVSRVEANARWGAEVDGPAEERRRIYIIEARDVVERLVVFEDGELLRTVEDPLFHAHFEKPRDESGRPAPAAPPAPESAAAAEPALAAESIPFPNGSFDDGEAQWFFARERGAQTRATAERCFSPPGALRIYADKNEGVGARVDSAFIPVRGPGIVELHYKVCALSGRSLGLYVRQYDADKTYLPIENWGECGGPTDTWASDMREILLDEKTAYLQIRFLPYPRDGEVVDMFFDDFELLRPAVPIPPWPGEYKLTAADTGRLTAADVVGPDGIAYPNWTQVGVQGGIPDVPVAATLAERGARPGTDIADLLDQACNEVAAAGGGAILIGEGVYYLDRPVVIRGNGVVVRGAGRDRTKLIFRYPVGQPGADAGFYWPPEGGAVGPDTQVEAHLYHIDLQGWKLFCNDQPVPGATLDFYNKVKIPGEALLALGGPGEAALRLEADYIGGHSATAERRVVLTPERQPVTAGTPMEAAIFFVGGGLQGTEYRLAEDGKRGDTTVVFADAADLAVGERIELHAPGTPRFKRRIQHLVGGDDWKRIGFYEIRAREGNRVTVNQPLRIDFPAIDGSYARRLDMVEGGGVEHLAIEHTCRLAVHSIMFDWGWNGWIRNVAVVKSGSNGAYAERSKWIEIRDCELDDPWNNDGGQAYAGFTSCADCLIDNCTVRRHRHGPVVQYGAMGCVFRNSRFDGSDLQWHAGWCAENLFENCTISSYSGSGSYGYGAYATGSADIGHGPNGPRNVVYNCDFTSVRAGVQLDGVNEAWIFLHNRFAVGEGPGFSVTRGSFDHVVRNNVFALADGLSPMARLATPDCVGIDLVGNTVVGGNGTIATGSASPAVEADNRALPEGPLPERPQAEVPSIFEWQRTNAGSP